MNAALIMKYRVVNLFARFQVRWYSSLHIVPFIFIAIPDMGDVNENIQDEHVEYTQEHISLHVIDELLTSLNHIRLLMSIDIHSFLYTRKLEAKLL